MAHQSNPMTPAEMVSAFHVALVDMLAARRSLGQPTDLTDQGVRDDIANNLALVAANAVEEAVEPLREYVRTHLAPGARR